MVRQVAVGKRIHSPGANEHRTRCCSGHPGMVQATAPGAYQPTKNALMGFRRNVGGTTSLRCGDPDTMRETGHQLVFHHAIIHENRFTVVKKLLCPLHLRMLCPKSGPFCNKRAFLWLFMKPVSYRAEGHRGHSAQAALPLTPTDVFALFPAAICAVSSAALWGGPGMWLAISAAFTGAALPALPGSSAKIACASLLCLSLGGDRLETLVHAPRRWPTRRRACVERRTCRYLHLAGTALPGIRPSRSG